MAQQLTLPGFVPIQPGTIVEYTVLRNGQERRFLYRRDAGRSWWAGGFWSYKPDGFDQWNIVRSPAIRRMLDEGIAPYEVRLDSAADDALKGEAE